MKNTAFQVLMVFMLASCSRDGGVDLSTWRLVKTHQAQKGEPLYDTFGPVNYSVSTNVDQSQLAIQVYGNRGLGKSVQLTGIISRDDQGDQPIWKMEVFDSNGKPWPEQQVRSSCQGCHDPAKGSMILGTYDQPVQ